MLEQSEQPRPSLLAAIKPSPDSLHPLRIAVFKGPQGLEEIRQDWKAITDRMEGHRHYFHLWEWQRDYLDTIAGEPDAAVFHVAYLALTPMAVLPLRATTIRQYGCSLRILETPYHKHMSLSDMICDPSPEHSDIPRQIIAHLRSSLRNDWDVLLLRGLLADSSSMSRRWQSLPGPRNRLMQDRCDSLRYATHEELLANISKNFRNNLRKARNKLAKFPEAKFEFVRDPAMLQGALEQFIRVEASGWKGDEGTGTAIGLDQRLRSFYEKLAASFGATGKCQINLLMLGEECVAGQFCLRLDGTLYILKIGYAEDHAQIAPGNLLLEECIRRSSTEGNPVRCWNLISVRWHDDWKPSHEAVCDLWIYNHTPRGLATWGWTFASRSLRSIYRKLRNILPVQDGNRS